MNYFSIKHFILRTHRLTVGVLAALLLAACASTPVPPPESLNAARNAIEIAEQAEARQYAEAELEEAQTQMTLAEEAVEAEQMIKADRLAQQARVAAELATARTEATKAAAINREMGRATDALDDEMRRQGDQQ